ncbi:MAG: hypothetical protein QOJ78_1328 [Pseudonocardiales bacterium]|nr:hypothetical protein [Pseudonocardiales bacterium]
MSVTARLVVGVDGSAGSQAAMGWALNEARLRGAALHVMLGWDYRPSWAAPGLGSMFPPVYSAPGDGSAGSETEAADAAGTVLDAVINFALAHDADSDAHPVSITRDVVQGPGAKVLLDEVTDADLLVVGSRGHGGFVGALLGSVSHQVVSQAPCPVVVVPNRQETTQAQ